MICIKFELSIFHRCRYAVIYFITILLTARTRHLLEGITDALSHHPVPPFHSPLRFFGLDTHVPCTSAG